MLSGNCRELRGLDMPRYRLNGIGNIHEFMRDAEARRQMFAQRLHPITLGSMMTRREESDA